MDKPTDARSETYNRGYQLLQRLGGTERPAVLDLFDGDTEDFGRLAVEFVYGHVYFRSGLDLRHRQLATVGALTALGYAPGQLRFHIGAALKLDAGASEIVESIIQVSSFAGFPATLNALAVAKEVLGGQQVEAEPEPADPRDRYERGLEMLRQVDGAAGEQVVRNLADIAPDLARFIIEFTFGGIYPRTGIDLTTREIVTVAACTALGTALPQLKVHVHGLLNVGGTREQVLETIMHTAVYAGFPAALNAIPVAREVFRERD